MMKKRFWLSVFLIVSMMGLVGWGKKKIELLNDKKLIDLNAAIGICIPGGDTPAHHTGRDDQEPGNQASWEIQEGRDDIRDRQRTLVIRIRGEEVTYDSVRWTGLDGLKDRIRQDYRGKASLRVIDDFAEAHVYRDIMEILSELESEIGLTYTEE